MTTLGKLTRYLTVNSDAKLKVWGAYQNKDFRLIPERVPSYVKRVQDILGEDFPIGKLNAKLLSKMVDKHDLPTNERRFIANPLAAVLNYVCTVSCCEPGTLGHMLETFETWGERLSMLGTSKEITKYARTTMAEITMVMGVGYQPKVGNLHEITSAYPYLGTNQSKRMSHINRRMEYLPEMLKQYNLVVASKNNPAPKSQKPRPLAIQEKPRAEVVLQNLVQQLVVGQEGMQELLSHIASGALASSMEHVALSGDRQFQFQVPDGKLSSAEFITIILRLSKYTEAASLNLSSLNVR